MRYRTICVDCGGAKNFSFALRCQPCRLDQYKAAEAVNRVISTQIRRGLLPKAKTQTCVDCGKPAHDWDHRDYSKPLDVVPVCRGCNVKRGPALRPKAEVAASISV